MDVTNLRSSEKERNEVCKERSIQALVYDGRNLTEISSKWGFNVPVSVLSFFYNRSLLGVSSKIAVPLTSLQFENRDVR